MQEALALPAWTETSELAKNFRVWFNNSARHKWNDFKNRSLRRTFSYCQAAGTDASAHPLTQIGEETWGKLLSTYEKNTQAVEGEQVKYVKNYELV